MDRLKILEEMNAEAQKIIDEETRKMKKEIKTNDIEELRAICLPVIEFLNKRNASYETVVISRGMVRLVEDLMGIPIIESGVNNNEKT